MFISIETVNKSCVSYTNNFNTCSFKSKGVTVVFHDMDSDNKFYNGTCRKMNDGILKRC